MTRLLLAFFLFACVIALSVWIAGSRLTVAVNHPIGAAPAVLGAEPVNTYGVHGWFVPASGSSSCVLLLHSVRSDRTSMATRSVFLK